MGALFGLLGGIRGIGMLAIIIALGGWAWMQKRNVDRANLERDQAIVQRDQVAVERDKAIEAARQNATTIARLEEEKVNLNEALNNIQAARETNRQNTVTREVIIERQVNVPANVAQAAPVLGDIIAEIQADRVRRRGGAASTNGAAGQRILE